MPRILLSTFWPQKTADILSNCLRQRAKEKWNNAYLHLPLGKEDGGGVQDHLEMWLIKKLWPTPSLQYKNDSPTPKARLEIA